MKLYDEDGLRVYLMTAAELNVLREVADGLSTMGNEMDNPVDADEAWQFAQLQSQIIKRLEDAQ